MTPWKLIAMRMAMTIRRRCASLVEHSLSSELLEFDGTSALPPPAIITIITMVVMITGDHHDEYMHHKHELDDGNYGYLVVLPCSEEQVGDYEEVLVKLVNCVGDRAVEVVFL